MSLPIAPQDRDTATINGIDYIYDAVKDAWTILGGTNHVGEPVGTIIDYGGVNLPPGYLLCDGSTFDTSVYVELAHILRSDTLPDLRDMFTRGIDDPANLDADFPQQQDTTRLPRNNFTTNNQGNHRHYTSHRLYNTDAGWTSGSEIYTQNRGGISNKYTNTTGDHSHTITGGGDAETAPKHVYVVKLIKAASYISVQGTPVAGVAAARGAALYHQAQAPSGPVIEGSIWSDLTGKVFIRAQNAWRSMEAVPVGIVSDFAGQAIPSGWQLCDGAEAQSDALSVVLGGGTGIGNRANVPDLRNMFVKGANTVGDIDPNTQHDDTTALPKNHFAANGVTSEDGRHHHHMTFEGKDVDAGWSGVGNLYVDPAVSGTNNHGQWTGYEGAHRHNVDITISGGDTETQPKHVILGKIIKF